MPVDLLQYIQFQKEIYSTLFQVYYKYQSYFLFVFPSKTKWGEKRQQNGKNSFYLD